MARYFNAFNKHAEALPSKDVVFPVIICPSLSSIANPGSLVCSSIYNAGLTHLRSVAFKAKESMMASILEIADLSTRPRLKSSFV